MATQSAVDIINGNDQISLYRHWDGYPAGAIPPLLQAAEVSGSSSTHASQHRAVTKAAEYLLGLIEPTGGEPLYRLTTDRDTHVGLNYHYVLDLREPQPIIEARICHTVDYERSIVASGAIFRGTLSQAARFCNEGRKLDHAKTNTWILADGRKSAAEAAPREVIPSRFVDLDEYRIPLDREAIITMLMHYSSEELGAKPGQIVAVLERIQDAGFEIRVFNVQHQRAYLAIEKTTGKWIFASKVDSLTDWNQVLTLAALCGVVLKAGR